MGNMIDALYHAVQKFRDGQVEIWEGAAHRKDNRLIVFDTIEEGVTARLTENQHKFIQQTAHELDDLKYFDKEILRLERVFKIPTYVIELEVRITKNGNTYPGKKVFTVELSSIVEGAAVGKIIVSDWLLLEFVWGDILYYHWLQKERPEQLEGTIQQTAKYLIWNGSQNSLADVIYQLRELTNEEGKPLLSGSNEELAVFLKSNFECFKDNAISTIKTYFDRSKVEIRPKLSKNKLTIIKGFPSES